MCRNLALNFSQLYLSILVETLISSPTFLLLLYRDSIPFQFQYIKCIAQSIYGNMYMYKYFLLYKSKHTLIR